MASCLGVRSAAHPAKILLRTSYLSLHCCSNQHDIISLQLGVALGGKPPLLSQLNAAGQAALLLQRRLWSPIGSSYLNGRYPQLGSTLSAAHSAGKIHAGQLTSEPAAAVHSDASTDSPSSQSAEVEAPHIPVLLNEVVEHFAGRKLGVFVDGTLGAAGHACAIIAAHPELQAFIGLDVDPRAHAEARRKIDTLVSGGGTDSESLSLHLVKSNFENVHAVLRSIEGGVAEKGVNGMLLDLGVSSMQVDEADRGFSFMRDGPLDMRMNPSVSSTSTSLKA